MDTLSQETLQRLIQSAKYISARAHAPYSRFHVGAVVVSTSGREYSACNVENASYGLACCAERSAVFQMVAGGEREIACVVIYTPTDSVTAPCGACRQVINEFGAQARIVCACLSEQRIDTTLDRLLPMAFGPHNLA